MKVRQRAMLVLLAAWGLLLPLALAQQDEGPVLKPKAKPKPASATLLVVCDLACNWKLDGEAKGHIDAGGSAKVKVELGQHMVVATTEDGIDQVKQISEVKSAEQIVVSIELQPVRDARLKAEQEARDRAAREQERDTAKLVKEGLQLFDQKRYVEARPMLESSCGDGSASSCTRLGILYVQGWGVAQDYRKARTLYEKACDAGDMLGCGHLGFLYQDGQGVTKDYGQARTLFQKACDGGSMMGCSALAWLYQNSLGVPQDYAKARSLLETACNGRYMFGCCTLGVLYQSGKGVTQDYAQARSLFEKACDAENLMGCTLLGALYEHGQGISQDYAQARTL
jgi:uncharacterized protein